MVSTTSVHDGSGTVLKSERLSRSSTPSLQEVSAATSGMTLN
jgi:hypothetical protein